VRPLPCPNTTVGKLHPEAEILLMTENETNTRTGESHPSNMAVVDSAVRRSVLRGCGDSRVTGKCKDGAVAKRYQRVPELVLGFDTETTGLSVSSERAVSYGFCAYRFGVPVWSEQFFVIPDRPISPGAKRVHGLSLEDIEAKRGSELVYSVETGLRRAVQILRDYHELGAYVVGSNVVRFDLEMLRRSCISVLASNSTTTTSTSRYCGSSTWSITTWPSIPVESSDLDVVKSICVVITG